jgi:hypothetical protein
VGTKIDPTLCRADRLVGQVLGEVGKLPEVFTELEINFFLLRRLLGVRADQGEKQNKVQKLSKGGKKKKKKNFFKLFSEKEKKNFYLIIFLFFYYFLVTQKKIFFLHNQ